MFITNDVEIVRRLSGAFVTSIFGVTTEETDPERTAELELLYSNCQGKPKTARPDIVKTMSDAGQLSHLFPTSITEDGTTVSAGSPVSAVNPMDTMQSAIERMISFFSEFQFEPNFRFINTLARNLAVDKQHAKSYISSYFELTDSPYCNEIQAKMRSQEFKELLRDFASVAPTKQVNNRFALYYGSQGTGKTTLAQTQTDNRCVICNSSMLPSDLMEDFAFDDGKAGFQKSMLWQCMEAGQPLVLDEINLLPYESLRFLQGLLDGKAEFQYKGVTVHINDGFEIIGTMNLTVNGMTYGLPEPLVDRCMEMRKFKLSANQLISAIV